VSKERVFSAVEQKCKIEYTKKENKRGRGGRISFKF
jgi:hypothetical protein